MTDTCVLCHRLTPRQAQFQSEGGLTKRVTCARCGTYLLQDVARPALLSRISSEDMSLRLSGLARIRSDQSDYLHVAADNLEALASSAPVPVSYSARVERLLVRVAERAKYPGVQTERIPVDEWAAPLFMPLGACAGLLQLLQKQELLAMSSPDVTGTSINLLPKGWERVDEAQRKASNGRAAFVAMWFDPSHRTAFDDGIAPALRYCGYEGEFRVDDPEHERHYGKDDYHEKIDDRIMAEIRRASLVVADITEGRRAVYFEAGFALGLGIPVIWTGQEKTFEKDTCFDTRQFGHIQWDTPKDLQDKLIKRIEARGLSRRG